MSWVLLVDVEIGLFLVLTLIVSPPVSPTVFFLSSLVTTFYLQTLLSWFIATAIPHG